MQYPFWVWDYNRVRDYEEQYPLSKIIFKQPLALWYGQRDKRPVKKLKESLQRLYKRAGDKEPIFCIYNLPQRDVGQYSKGGARTEEYYYSFIEQFAEGIGQRKPIVIFEPDALPHTTHMSKADALWRLEMMKTALNMLTEKSNAIVYVDVGHSNWLDPSEAGKLLDAVSNSKVRGFSVNISNYRTTKECTEWALKVCEHRPNDYFVIDTSRNGNGPYGNEWCNPPGRALGELPTTDTNVDKCDALLWIKIPGESDGTKNKGPRAGRMWGEMAEELVRNSKYNG